MTFETRKARLEDAREIVEVHITTWKTSYRGLIADDILDGREISEDKIANMQTAIGKGLVWVAAKGTEIIGFAGLKETGKTDEAEIVVLYVLPKFQQCGVGKALFNAVCSELKAQNYREMIIWTMQEAPSVKFYQSIGGTLTGNCKLWKYEKNIVELVWKL